MVTGEVILRKLLAIGDLDANHRCVVEPRVMRVPQLLKLRVVPAAFVVGVDMWAPREVL